MTGPFTITASLPVGPKPRDDELDLFGLTHPGKVRARNEDHFMVCTVHRQLVVHGSSLPDTRAFPLRGDRLASVVVVADGVGGAAAGEEASQLAVETIARYLTGAMECFDGASPAHEETFLAALHGAALEAHAAVLALAAERPTSKGMATTLTLVIGAWPRAYVVQVGDSRCYYYRAGQLHQVTRDQTVAQTLVDAGALRQSQAHQSPFSNVLASAIGGIRAEPVVTRLLMRRDAVFLVCSDGLTKHVTDARIAAVLGSLRSAEQACTDLLQFALDGGGTDNVTIVVGRVRPA